MKGRIKDRVNCVEVSWISVVEEITDSLYGKKGSKK